MDSIMATTRTCVIYALLIFTALFLTGCGGGGTSTGGSTVASYTISSDGSSVTCHGADSRATSGGGAPSGYGVVVCGWNCGTYKGHTGLVILSFIYKSPSFYLSGEQYHTDWPGCW